MTKYKIKQDNDGTWLAWPQGGGPLRSATGKGWGLVAEIHAEGGHVHWQGHDIDRFTQQFGPAPEALT